jgi:hypothetical protein
MKKMIGLEESDSGSKKKVSNELGGLGKRLNDDLKERLEAIWNAIYNDAVAECPVDTMSLVGTVKLIVDDSNIQASGAGVDIMSSGMSENIYNATIIAGDDAVINPKNHIPTSWYAIWVHDGHFTVDGAWVEGVPFLSDAVDKHIGELDEAIDDALKDIGGE